MDDVTTTTATVIQTRYLLQEIHRFFTWARLTVKAEKCRALVIQHGVVQDRRIMMADAEITSIKKKPVKYLGKEYSFNLNDRAQIEEITATVKKDIRKIDTCMLPGRYKAWILQHLFLPRLMWPLTIYSIPQTRIEGFQQKITSALKKWLGFPRSLTSEALYARSAKVQLPFSSLCEEVKAARVRMKVTLETSKDACIKGAEIDLDAGTKWKVSEGVEEARFRLRQEEIAGIPNKGREGLGLSHRQYYSKASQREKRGLIVQKVRKAEEERRMVKVAGLSKQGQSFSWEVQQKSLSDRELLTFPEARLTFLMKSVYDLLPTPANKNRWFKTDEFNCMLCGKAGTTLNHILTGCKVALAQGRYTWRHNKVLEEIAHWIEKKRKTMNQMPIRRRSWIKFVKGGKKAETPGEGRQSNDCYLSSARDWKMQVDLGAHHLVVPAHIVTTDKRPDIILTSESTRQMCIVELTVPREDRLEVSGELKKTNYEELIVGGAGNGWRVTVKTVEVGCRGFAFRSLSQVLRDVGGYEGRERKQIVKKIEVIAEQCSHMIWKWSHYKSWGRDQ